MLCCVIRHVSCHQMASMNGDATWGMGLRLCCKNKLGGLWSNIPVSTFFNHSRFESFTARVPPLFQSWQLSARPKCLVGVKQKDSLWIGWWANLVGRTVATVSFFTFYYFYFSFVFYFTGIQLQRHAGVWVDWILGKNVLHCGFGLYFALYCWETCLAAF